MPTKRKRTLKEVVPLEGGEGSKVETTKGKRSLLRNMTHVFATSFFAVWTLIGLFLIILTLLSLKQGNLRNILNTPAATNSGESQQVQAPAEANLPGVGIVNVPCVREALSQESIQKILDVGDMSVLTDEEKTNLEKCIVEKADTSASPSPAQ